MTATSSSFATELGVSFVSFLFSATCLLAAIVPSFVVA